MILNDEDLRAMFPPPREHLAQPMPASDGVMLPGGPPVRAIQHGRLQQAVPGWQPAMEAAPVTAGGGIMRCQVLRVLGDAGTPDDVRRGLLRHLAEHSGSPEQALLSHLHDWQDDETL